MKNDIKFIKLTVYLMGVAMAIGVITIALTIYKLSLPLEKDCKPQKLEVTDSIKQATIFKDKITILTELNHNKQQIIILDYCTGKYINSYDITIKNKP